LKQFVRDWSVEGKNERDTTYNPILDELESIYKNIPFEERGKIKILVPGAGLGRLVYEVVAKGFSCQGNEFSFFMLLASNYILNQVKEPLSIPIYPWIHQHCNMPSAEIQTAEVRIPDVLISDGVPSTADFSMVAGDFIEVYSEPHQLQAWDVIVTCFFIDTNKNFLKYLQVISKALKSNLFRNNFY
jgi:carnosine N-methyltransferase